MNGMMTRNKAAEYLNVTPQTITNWCKGGLLGYCYGEHNMLYVNAEDIEKYAKKYKMIAVNERMLDSRLKELKTARHASDKELTDLRNSTIHVASRHIPTDGDLSSFVWCLYENLMIPGMRQREAEIMVSFMSGKLNIYELSAKYGLTRERIRQIFNKGCRRITENMGEITTNICENTKLRRQVTRQTAEINELRNELATSSEKSAEMAMKKEANRAWEEIREIVDVPFRGLGFSTRTLNCLDKISRRDSYDDYYFGRPIETIFDLLPFVGCTRKLLAIRDLGKKSIGEIDDFLQANRLSFKRPGESKEEFIIRLNKTLKYYNNDNGDNDW